MPGTRRGSVLVCVLKTKRDKRILLEEGWYRIPSLYLPRRRFTHLAFYQPAAFGGRKKRIEYYARVKRMETRKRADLLPEEALHPRTQADYCRITVGKATRLPHPILNTSPRRVSFGFTSLKLLKRAKNILQIYQVPETEIILAKELRRRKINHTRQLVVKAGRRIYRLDFAIDWPKRMLAVECDNLRAHSSAEQRRRDGLRDKALQANGWRILRFNEEQIQENPRKCGQIIRECLTNRIK